MDAGERHASDDDGDLHAQAVAGDGSRFKHQIAMTQFIKNAWAAERPGVLIAAETGTGKTRGVLDFITNDQRVLVVVPAIARGEWIRQASLWAPHLLNIRACDTGEKVREWQEEQSIPGMPGGILVTSYQLLKHIQIPFDVVCLDECQMISSPDAQMTQEASRVIGLSENTMVVALSATPALDRPDQLYSVLSLCEPGRWGDSIWAFRRRYCNAIPNEFAPSGIVYKGLRIDRSEELRRRLEPIMFRVRKSDIADQLPPLTISMRYVKPKRSKLDWDDESSFESLLQLNSSTKVDTAIDLIDGCIAGGERRFVVFTYLRDTAGLVGDRLRALGLEVEVVTGAIPADARHTAIERVRTAKGPSALVCNIDAIGVSLDFTFAQTSVFVEQHWRPGSTLQAIGRLQRLSSKHAAQCIFIVCEGSKEQRQAETFCRKQSDLNAILPAGRDEKSAVEALNRVESDDDILKGLL